MQEQMIQHHGHVEARIHPGVPPFAGIDRRVAPRPTGASLAETSEASTVLSAQDHVELLNLYSRSTRLVKPGDEDAWADLYVEDGACILPEIRQFDAEPMVLRGREALRTFASNVIHGVYHPQMGLAPTAKKRFVISNVVLEADGPRAARGSAYLLLVILGEGGPPRTLGFATYDDHFVKTSKGWRIKQRTLNPES
ncbi:MAG: nuclear transport factor 2 family protein [Thermoanaerobaculia bacterium]|nr:nuclear transport factor 2 family protein [Thermoanaerobaculia bacterium]